MAYALQGLRSTHPEEHYHTVKRKWSDRLLTGSRSVRAFGATSAAPHENVVGVAIGEKTTGGRHTGIAAVKFFVTRKFDDAALSKEDRLPTDIEGVPVDVEEVGVLRALQVALATAAPPDPKTKLRPAQPGCSVGFEDPNHQFRMAGTFGALVVDHETKARAVLSNNHVLADEGRLPKSSPIFQPGLLDAPNGQGNQIARLIRFKALVPPPGVNHVDGAVAPLIEPNFAIPDILQIGQPSGSRPAALQMTVHKFGRTTSYTVGRVVSISADVRIQYETGDFIFQDQVVIRGANSTSFSAAGDSGSLIVERKTAKAVGLLFAGSASHTIANQIADVLDQLNVSLV